MQTKQAIIGIVAAIVILFGAGGVFLYSQNKSPQPQPNSTTTATDQENKKSSMSDSLTSLLKSGKTQKCTFSSQDIGGGNTQGTAYLTTDKMRTDLTITSSDKTSMVYVIRNGDDNYIWGSEFPNSTGLKMTLSIDEYESNSDSREYFDPTKKLDYDCSGWTVDSSVFVPPSNIKFSDLSSMMQGMMKSETKPTGAAPSSSASNCSVCNSLTGSAKTSCLAQLNCQ